MTHRTFSPGGPAVPLNWDLVKMDISRATGISPDALHVLTGMLILVLAAVALRRPPWSWQAWLVVAIAETVNEAYDMLQTIYPSDEGNIRASLHDFALTLFWPSVIVLLFPMFVTLTEADAQASPVRRMALSREFGLGLGTSIGIGLLLVWLGAWPR